MVDATNLSPMPNAVTRCATPSADRAVRYLGYDRDHHALADGLNRISDRPKPTLLVAVSLFFDLALNGG